MRTVASYKSDHRYFDYLYDYNNLVRLYSLIHYAHDNIVNPKALMVTIYPKATYNIRKFIRSLQHAIRSTGSNNLLYAYSTEYKAPDAPDAEGRQLHHHIFLLVSSHQVKQTLHHLASVQPMLTRPARVSKVGSSLKIHDLTTIYGCIEAFEHAIYLAKLTQQKNRLPEQRIRSFNTSRFEVAPGLQGLPPPEKRTIHRHDLSFAVEFA